LSCLGFLQPERLFFPSNDLAEKTHPLRSVEATLAPVAGAERSGFFWTRCGDEWILPLDFFPFLEEIHFDYGALFTTLRDPHLRLPRQ